MDEGIKRKLVGAAVLVVAAIIILPMITSQAQNASYLSRSVPIEEQVPDMSMPLPKSLSISKREAEDEKEQAVIKLTPLNIDGDRLAPNDIEIPVVDASGQSRVWHIQVASFAEPNNAITLRDKLRSSGYKAFDRLSEDGKHVRVFVGPSTQKLVLEKKLTEINRTFNLKGQLTPYIGN